MKIMIKFNAAELKRLYSEMEKDGKKLKDRTIVIDIHEDQLLDKAK